MKKLPILFVLALIVSALATQAFAKVPVQVHTGIVVGYEQGKSMTVRESGNNLVDYNLTSNTKVVQPSDMNGALDAGARVTIVATRMNTAQTNGWIVLAIIVRQPATNGSAAPAQAPAPQPTPTP